MWSPPATAILMDDQDDPPEQTKTSKECADGEIWDERREECVSAQESSLGKEVLYGAARELAHAGRYKSAAAVVSAIPDTSESKVLALKGFIARNQENPEAALTYYRAALSADPDNLLARSYLGMWFVEKGDIDKARSQLAEILRRGGGDGWPGRALKQAIARGMGYAA